jgi:WD40 repeat protein
MVVLSLLTGSVVSVAFALRAGHMAADASANAHQAQLNADQASANADRMRAEKERADQNLYVAHVNLAQRAWEDGQVGRARGLLEQELPARTGGHDFRGFEWHCLHRLCYPDAPTLQAGTPLNAVAFSPDGKYLATASGRNRSEVRIWDTATRRLVRSLPPGAGQVTAVALGPGGRRLAIGSADGSVKLWDVATGKELPRLHGHTTKILAVAFSPDGTRLATAGEKEAAMRIWEGATGQEVRSIPAPPPSEVCCLAWSPDGKRLAAGGEPKEVEGIGALEILQFAARFAASGGKLQMLGVWDAQSGRKILTLQHDDSVNAVAWSPDGRQLASAGSDKSVRVWGAATGRETLTLAWQPEWVTALAWGPDGKWLASSGINDMIRVWDTRTATERMAFVGGPTVPAGLAFSPDGRRLVGATANGVVTFWPTTGSPDSLTVPLPDAAFATAAFSPDGHLLAVPSGSGVKVWDLAAGKTTRTLGGNPLADFFGGDVTRVAWSPDGKRLASASLDDTVRVWDLAAGKVVMTSMANMPAALGHNVLSMTFSPDSRYLATSGLNRSMGGAVSVWDLATLKKVFAGPGDRAAFGPDGHCLVVTHSGEALHAVLQVNDVTAAKEVRRIPAPTPIFTSEQGWGVLLSPDGQALAAVYWDGRVRIWDVAGGQEGASFETTASPRVCPVFSADHRRLATAEQDRVVKVWDTASGQELLRLKGPPGGIAFLAFSPDGGRLLAGNSEGAKVLKVWDGTPRQAPHPPAGRPAR